MSFGWNGNSYELKESIATREYYQSKSLTIQQEVFSSVCDRDDNDNGLAQVLKNVLTSKTSLWKASISDYFDFFGPILIVKDQCSIHSQFCISYSAKRANENTIFSQPFLQALKSLENSMDSTVFELFHYKYGPYVAIEIDYGFSQLYSNYSTVPVGFNKTIYTQTSLNNTIPMGSYSIKAQSNPEPVQFQPILLTDFISNITSTKVIETLKLLNKNTDYGFTNYYIQDAIEKRSMCEKNNLVIFGNSDQDIIGDSTATQESLSFFRNYYSWNYNKHNWDNKKYYYETYDRSIRKENNLFSFSLTKSLLFDVPIYGMTRQCEWPYPTKLEVFFSTTQPYNSTEKNERFNFARLPMGYCSSTRHLNMVPLNRFRRLDKTIHAYSLAQDYQNYEFEREECFVYPIMSNYELLPAENICFEK